ncbi:MAG: phet bact: phenylalanine--trna ligase beta subunit [Verrucomicrobiales bacterium]|nr:phet bact: phenylalanine--trna ligase beta subunit [Verrucomicrobiales bacterium]
MKVSFNWLADHLDLSAHSTAQLSDLLTFAGIEVEGITERGVRSDFLIVGKVVSFVPHPNADRLRLCQVDDGSGTPRQIVCGAKNFEPGDKVPVALPGAVLPGGFQIKESQLRGSLSQGMMCAGREIGFSDDADGLMILPADAPVGTPIHEYLEVDTMLEVEVTPNRPDLLSHLGMARELAALAKLNLKSRGDYSASSVKTQAAEEAEIQLVDTEGCPYYTARRIRGVKVAPSPAWLVRKLESVGLRPINNIVDITNYVLMEMAQPLHAFDAAKLDGGIVVRSAAEGEKFLALDGRECSLAAVDLVIADGKQAVALAGVMGGALSGVTDETTDILLEAAWFQPSRVRHTSRRLAMMSDSSYRFERGVDPQQTAGASELAVRLILELAGGTADEVLLTAGAPPVLTSQVTLDLPRAQRLLGTPISEAEVTDILTRLNLKPLGGLAFGIPGYRQDLQRPVDLVEEIARVHGIANIPATTDGQFVPASAADAVYDFKMTLRQRLVGQGLFEAQTIKLISTAQVEDSLGTTPQLLPVLPLRNPLSDDHTIMRPSLLPGLLGVAERNIRMGTNSLRFFETGTVFARTPDGKAIEKDALALLLCGPVSPIAWNRQTPAAADPSELRAVLDALCPGVSVKLKPVPNARLLTAAQIIVNGKPVGLCGQLQPARVRALDSRHPVFAAEIDTTLLLKALTREVKFDELPRFPGISRDIALEVPADLANGKLEDFFSTRKEPLLTGATLFDVFADPTGQKIAADKKSLAYTLTYRDSGKTLSTAEVDTAHNKVVAELLKAHSVTVR